MSKLKIEESVADNEGGFHCSIYLIGDADSYMPIETVVLAESHFVSSKEKALRLTKLVALETLNAWASEIATYYGDSVQ